MSEHRTNFEAYSRAQEALKKLEDMTFSDEEIDAFLPKELKRITKGRPMPEQTDLSARRRTVLPLCLLIQIALTALGTIT
jgi:hypothetical protein